MPELFTEADMERVRAAVAAAETQTAGEIVPYVVERSGRYEVALWRGGAIAALLAMLLGLGTAWAYDGWGMGWLYTGWGMVLVALAGGVVGAGVVALVPGLRRALAGAGRIDQRVERRAALAFLEEEVFKTRDRTGILLFVSLFEHRIEVLGDEGINAKVADAEWAEVVARVRRGIRQGSLADGLVDAIALCGELLHRRGVEIRDDDEDELPDRLRFRAE